MSELDALAGELRKELGAPPQSFLDEQRFRVRRALSPRAQRARAWRLVAITACALIAAAGVFFAVSEPREQRVERWLVASELREPFRLADGSSIALEPAARGRLTTDDSDVRFDLHAGRARFDVRPDRERSWIVTAGKNEVRVIGTRFSVLYGPSEALEVEVERGVVSVQVPDRKATIELQAGEHLRGQPGRVEVGRTTDAPREPDARPATTTSVAIPASAPNAAETTTPPARSSASSAPAGDDWQTRYREGKYVESLALLRASGLGQRLNALPAATLSELADAARLGGDPELAIRALSVLTQRFPSSPEARHGKFLLGRLHAMRGDRAAAVTALESYLGASDRSTYATEAIGRLMELYSQGGNTDRARSMAQRYLERAPNGPYQRLARSLTGTKP